MLQAVKAALREVHLLQGEQADASPHAAFQMLQSELFDHGILLWEGLLHASIKVAFHKFTGCAMDNCKPCMLMSGPYHGLTGS